MGPSKNGFICYKNSQTNGDEGSRVTKNSSSVTTHSYVCVCRWCLLLFHDVWVQLCSCVRRTALSLATLLYFSLSDKQQHIVWQLSCCCSWWWWWGGGVCVWWGWGSSLPHPHCPKIIRSSVRREAQQQSERRIRRIIVYGICPNVQQTDLSMFFPVYFIRSQYHLVQIWCVMASKSHWATKICKYIGCKYI